MSQGGGGGGDMNEGDGGGREGEKGREWRCRVRLAVTLSEARGAEQPNYDLRPVL